LGLIKGRAEQKERGGGGKGTQKKKIQSRTHRKTQKTGEQQGWTKNKKKTRGGLVEDE
jgi:hypothetical protein